MGHLYVMHMPLKSHILYLINYLAAFGFSVMTFTIFSGKSPFYLCLEKSLLLDSGILVHPVVTFLSYILFAIFENEI